LSRPALACPSEYSVRLLDWSGVTADPADSRGVAATTEDRPAMPAALLVGRARFAVGPCPGPAGLTLRTASARVNQPIRALALRSPSEFCPADPSRRHPDERPLSWACFPYSTCKVRRSTARGLCLPATFRPQGLAALSAAFSLRTRAGLVSCRQRSWDSPFGAFSAPCGIRGVSAGMDPLAVFPSGTPAA